MDIIMDYKHLARRDTLNLKHINERFVSFKYAAFCFTRG